ncbi:hypothetical protein D6779_09780 [Candidatus Parcubacteria bacterium]|nr:MAG: hypothetical protein D6779_09780 [Candidatus Parcubacteria bacterium]
MSIGRLIAGNTDLVELSLYAGLLALLLFVVFWAFSSSNFYVISVQPKPYTLSKIEPKNFQVEIKHKIVSYLAVLTLLGFFTVMFVGIPTMAWITYQDNTLLKNVWTPVRTTAIVCLVLFFMLHFLEMEKATLTISNAGMLFRAWKYSVFIKWDGLRAIHVKNNTAFIGVDGITSVQGNVISRLYWRLFGVNNTIIPLSLFSGSWEKSELKECLEKNLLFEKKE